MIGDLVVMFINHFYNSCSETLSRRIRIHEEGASNKVLERYKNVFRFRSVLSVGSILIEGVRCKFTVLDRRGVVNGLIGMGIKSF